MSNNKRYSLGYILDSEGNRLETRPDDVSHLVKFLLNTNFITNIDITYVTIDFTTNTNQEIYNKLNNESIYIWITAVEDKNVLRLWESFFKYERLKDEPISTIIFPENRNKFLISVIDELAILKNSLNILHINNISDIICNQYANIIWNKISLYEDQSYKTLYIFYDNEHTYQFNIFRNAIQNLDKSNDKNYIYCNIDNYVELSQTITKIQTDTYSQKLTFNNTLFIYFMNKLDIYFQVYSIVEDPVLVADINVSNNIRHYPYYQFYAITNFIDIQSLMIKYLVPKFIENPTVSKLSLFFKQYLRTFIIGPSLTKYQANKYNYLNYTYYVKSPVDINFLKYHRITIYSILVEKAIKIAKNILYRDIQDLNILYNSSLYLDGKCFGLINEEITGNPIDYSYFNRLIYITYNLKDLYYITEPSGLKYLRQSEVIEPVKSGVSAFITTK